MMNNFICPGCEKEIKSLEDLIVHLTIAHSWKLSKLTKKELRIRKGKD